MDLRQTFVIGASWDEDELVRFGVQKVKGQGHIIATDASITRVHRFLYFSTSIFIFIHHSGIEMCMNRITRKTTFTYSHCRCDARGLPQGRSQKFVFVFFFGGDGV